MKHFITPLIALLLFGGILIMFNIMIADSWEYFKVGNATGDVALTLIFFIATSISTTASIGAYNEERREHENRTK